MTGLPVMEPSTIPAGCRCRASSQVLAFGDQIVRLVQMADYVIHAPQVVALLLLVRFARLQGSYQLLHFQTQLLAIAAAIEAGYAAGQPFQPVQAVFSGAVLPQRCFQTGQALLDALEPVLIL